MRVLFACVLGALCVLPTTATHADIYAFVDAQGITHYTNVPTDSRYQFLLATPSERTQSGDAYDRALLAKSVEYDAIIETAAVAASVEPDLLRAVIVVESGFNARAVSKKGAVGLMQLMPATAQLYGAADRYDATQNIHAGARYLQSLIKRYDNDLRLVLAAYNAGEDAVDRCGRCIPAYAETQAYVPKVWRVYQTLLGRGAA
jgi:soluble lytic murein transglycosylase-like protein